MINLYGEHVLMQATVLVFIGVSSLVFVIVTQYPIRVLHLCSLALHSHSHCAQLDGSILFDSK